MKLCRFRATSDAIHPGLIVHDTHVLDLAAAGIERLTPLFENEALVDMLSVLAKEDLPRRLLKEVELVSPVERQEVWAVGVTYIRSKKARMDESEFSATAYDRVYEAERPELFFKAVPDKVVAPGHPVGIRRDARWSVPEPELAFIISSTGHIAGFTIGNDMSSRDIEGENLLYLPQAKIYNQSCAIGPAVRIGANETDARRWNIFLQINRAGAIVFSGQTSVSQIKRSFAELVEFLFRSQSFPHGAVLLTGTGIIPPDDFTLQQGDRVTITIEGIGTLQNDVAIV